MTVKSQTYRDRHRALGLCLECPRVASQGSVPVSAVSAETIRAGDPTVAGEEVETGGGRMRFQVMVELTYHVPYRVKAESAEAAEKLAIEMAHDGMGLMNADIISADVVDVADESSEER